MTDLLNPADYGNSLEKVLRMLAQYTDPDAFAELRVTAHSARVLITHMDWLSSQLANRPEQIA
jgi:hypothetical protein